jgi:cytochrome c2
MIRALAVLLVSQAWFAAHATDFDSTRGAAVLEAKGCVECHTRNGGPGQVAPDLSRPADRAFSPTALATTLWNHAPTMWKTIQSRGEKVPQLDEQAAGDLFAYFYSLRFFESPGDAARGKHVFQDRSCSGCHSLGSTGKSVAAPVSQWTAIGDPVALAQAMWNHAPNMREELAVRRKHWPQLSTQDLADLDVFVRNSPEGRGKPAAFVISSNSDAGAALFRSKGCEDCHTSNKIPLEKRIGGLTLTGIAAQMWNHAPLMRAVPPRFEGNEMRDLLSYIWTSQFFGVRGDAARGGRLFAAKHCEVCHADKSSGAPPLPSKTGKFNGISMVSALWRHGPGMLGRMEEKNIAWPHLGLQEMSAIIAYLNAGDRK